MGSPTASEDWGKALIEYPSLLCRRQFCLLIYQRGYILLDLSLLTNISKDSHLVIFHIPQQVYFHLCFLIAARLDSPTLPSLRLLILIRHSWESKFPSSSFALPHSNKVKSLRSLQSTTSQSSQHPKFDLCSFSRMQVSPFHHFIVEISPTA